MFPGSTNALVMFDRATGWTECAPLGALNHDETMRAMRFFQGTSGRKVKLIRRVKEGGRSNLIQSGLPYTWWPWAVTHHCAARNIQNVDGTSLYNKRHRSGKCQAVEIPFGALILYAPTPVAGNREPLRRVPRV